MNVRVKIMLDKFSNNYSELSLVKFIKDSLQIEGINRSPSKKEIEATIKFIDEALTLDSVCKLQAVYAPGKPLRDKKWMNVRIGNYSPQEGGESIKIELSRILEIKDPYHNHMEFETLHPFMDGNGRTGRSIWVKLMLESSRDPFSLSFLHRFYYQTLASHDERNNISKNNIGNISSEYVTNFIDADSLTRFAYIADNVNKRFKDKVV